LIAVRLADLHNLVQWVTTQW